MSDLRALRLAAIDAALDHFGQKLDDFCPPGEVLAADSDWAGDVRADAWEEHKHPRDPDGKFASGGGSATFKSYAESAKVDPKTGKPKLQASAFIKHMLMQGTMSVDEIFAELQKEFEYPNNQKPHVKYYWKELKKKGVDVPEIGSKKALEDATQEILEETGVKAEQEPKEEAVEEVTSGGVDYTHPLSADAKGNLDFFIKYAGAAQKNLAAALAEVKTEYPSTVAHAVATLKSAVNQDHGPKKVADILAIESIGSDSDDEMAKDAGVKGFNALLGAVQEAWKKDAQAVKAPAPEVPALSSAGMAISKHSPHMLANAPKDLYSSVTNGLHDKLLNDMLAAPAGQDAYVKKADDAVTLINSIASQADHAKAYKELGVFKVENLGPFQKDVTDLAYSSFVDLMKHVEPKDFVEMGYDKKPFEPFTSGAPAAPESPPPKPKAAHGEMVGTATKDFHDNLKSYWPTTLPENLAAVKEQDEKIEVALGLDTLEEQKAALATIEPFGEGQLGMAKKAMDDYLTKVKHDYGINTPAAGLEKGKTKKGTGLSPKQTKQATQIATLAHKSSEQIHKLEDYNLDKTKKIKAVLATDTEKIHGNYYAEVTAAYSGNLANSLEPAVDHTMENYAGSMSASFSAPERSSLKAYKNGVYDEINKALLGTQKSTPDVQAHIDNIANTIANSYVPADTPVFRGLKCDLKELTGFDNPEDAVGRCFEHKCFASVSRRRGTSEFFGTKTMLQFTIPAGTPGTVMFGQNGGEREIILDKRSMFRIDKVEDTSSQYHKGSYMLHVTYLGRRDDG